VVDHVFGGDWNEIKLGLLAKCLAAYRQVFTRNAKAGFFRTWYVDAFAGTGSRTAGDSRAIGGGIFGSGWGTAGLA
jgi:hypothetical protein